MTCRDPDFSNIPLYKIAALSVRSFLIPTSISSCEFFRIIYTLLCIHSVVSASSLRGLSYIDNPIIFWTVMAIYSFNLLSSSSKLVAIEPQKQYTTMQSSVLLLTDHMCFEIVVWWSNIIFQALLFLLGGKHTSISLTGVCASPVTRS